MVATQDGTILRAGGFCGRVNLSRLPYSAGSTAGKVGETQISHKYHHEIQQTATVAGKFDRGNILQQWQVGSWGCGDRDWLK